MSKYPIEIFWSDEDEGYIALMPDLPGCCAWGATQEQAVKEIRYAASAWLEAAKKMNREIPRPKKSLYNQRVKIKDELYTSPLC